MVSKINPEEPVQIDDKYKNCNMDRLNNISKNFQFDKSSRFPKKKKSNLGPGYY
jgi:hypothetical protein